jgi:hypothetical protein
MISEGLLTIANIPGAWFLGLFFFATGVDFEASSMLT